jgi:hypothetical protein
MQLFGDGCHWTLMLHPSGQLSIDFGATTLPVQLMVKTYEN